MNSSILTIKFKDNTQIWISINSRLIKDGKILAKKVDFNTIEKVKDFKLMLLVDDLAAKNFDLIYILLLNNGLGTSRLLIDDLTNAN